MKPTNPSLQLSPSILLVVSILALALGASAQALPERMLPHSPYSADVPRTSDNKYLQRQQNGTYIAFQREAESPLTSAVVVTGTKLVATHSFGGSTWTVTGIGNRLYYNAGSDLVIADIANPAAPLELGRWVTSNKASFYNIQAAGSLVYIPHNFAGVDIVDFTTPDQPVQVGNIPTGNSGYSINSVAISGTNAYVLEGKRFRVVDVTVPAAPVNSATITPTAGFLNSLAVSGRYAYAAAGSSGLVVIDVFNPASPTVTGTLGIPGYAAGIAYQGSYVYVVTYDAMRIINVSNPNAPTQVGIYQPSGFSPWGDLAVSGNSVYLQDWDKLHIIDVSIPSTPAASSILPLPSSNAGIYVPSSTVYLGTLYDGLAIVGALDPAAPVLMGTVAKMPYADSLSRDGGVTLVTSGRTVWAIMSSATSLTTLPVFTSTRQIGGINSKGGLAYLAEYNESSNTSTLEVLNMANPFAPTSLGTAPLTIQNAGVIVVTGTFVYVGSWQGTSAVNVTNPAAPQESSWQAVPSGVNVRGITPHGNKLYVITTSDLRIYDITTPSTMTSLVTWPGTRGSAIAVDGRYAYTPASGGAQGIQIIDVSTPSSPTFVKNLSGCGATFAVAIYSGYLYSLNGCRAIQLYDVRDPVNASNRSISWVDIPSFGEQVLVDSDKILVADGAGGFVQAQRFAYSSDYIPVSGGGLTSPDGAVNVTVPANTYTNTVSLRYEDKPAMTTGSLNSMGRFFAITAYYTNTWTIAPLSPGQSLTVTLTSFPSVVRQDTLGLYRFDGITWTQSGISSTVDATSRQVTARLTIFSGNDTFALLGQSYLITMTVDPDSSTTLVYTGTQNMTTTISVPVGAVTSTLTLAYAPLYTASAPEGLSFAGHAFDLDVYQGDSLLPGFVFSKPVTITIHYSSADVAGLAESTLALQYWNGSTWASDGISVVERNPAQNYVVFTISHLSEFALFATESHKVYLPVVIRQ